MLTEDDKQWISQLVAGMTDHLLHEMSARFAEVNERLESLDARLKFQAGFIQSGNRALSRFAQYTENSEERWVDLAKRMRVVEQKLGINGDGQANNGGKAQ